MYLLGLVNTTIFFFDTQDCLVPRKYPEDPKLGNWVMNMRSYWRKHRRTKLKQVAVFSPSHRLYGSCLIADRLRRLESIGFVWHAPRGHPRKQESPTLDNDEGDDDEDNIDEDDNEENPDGNGNSRNSTTDAKRKRGHQKKCKRGRPRKQEQPTFDNDHSTSKQKRPKKLAKETTRSPVASLNTEQKEEPRREPGTEIGSSVYAKWENGDYYWAIITDIKRKTNSHYDQYTVRIIT